MSEQKTAVQIALENPVYAERVAAAAAILGVTEEELATELVEREIDGRKIGATTVEDLEDEQGLSWRDMIARFGERGAVKVRRALAVLKGTERSMDKDKSGDAGVRDLVKDLRDESKLWQLTEGHPLLCEHGGTDHSAANIRHFRKTHNVPKVCVFAGCGKLLQHAMGEVSFEDNATFLSAEGVNPTTGRNEGKFPLADRALAFNLICGRTLTVDEAWRRLEDGSLRTHYAVAAAELENEHPGYASDLRKAFQGVRTGTDPFYRDRESGHVRY